VERERFETWIPSKTNPSKVIKHIWNPEKDEWTETVFAMCLPSKAWGSWPKKEQE
jgi:hypothetical protein